MMKYIWKPLSTSNGNKLFDVGKYAVLVLNQPIKMPKTTMIHLWNEAAIRASADGGTDRWFEFASTINVNSLNQAHPDLVAGDFDSINPETLHRCRQSGTVVIETPDQDKTDFRKALEQIMKHTKEKLDTVVAVVDTAGRLDHIMSNLNTLYEREDMLGPVGLYLVGSDSLTWLLPAGFNAIHIPSQLLARRQTCGLIPLGAPCVVTTTGLKWNLDNRKMEFGGLVSSCNTYSDACSGVVTVDTDAPLLWTMTLGLCGL